jgi:ABC-type lipoprotein export system ATPase subunit
MELHEIAVRCRGIHKDFGDGDARIEVLRGVDLRVRLGEMLFLVGPSGSGKTTLISVIAVTHDNRIMDFADRIAFMEDGCIERVESAPQRPRNVRPQLLSSLGGAL